MRTPEADKTYVFRESDGARFRFLYTETKDGRFGLNLNQDGWLGHVHVTPMALLANFTAYPHAVSKQHRPFITLPSDQPSYETLTDLTMEQKAALPARFHTPVWTDSTPGTFICAVCWVEGEMVSWPCAPALRKGWDVFDRPRSAPRLNEAVAAELDRLIEDRSNYTASGDFRPMVLVTRGKELRAESSRGGA